MNLTAMQVMMMQSEHLAFLEAAKRSKPLKTRFVYISPLSLNSWVQPQSDIREMMETEMKTNTVDVMSINTAEDREAFAQLMSNGLYLIRFRKVNGELRDMICTRNSKIIERTQIAHYGPRGPAETKISKEEDPFAEDAAKARQEKACAVFDVEKCAWRSFKWNSILGFEYVGNDI